MHHVSAHFVSAHLVSHLPAHLVSHFTMHHVMTHFAIALKILSGRRDNTTAVAPKAPIAAMITTTVFFTLGSNRNDIRRVNQELKGVSEHLCSAII